MTPTELIRAWIEKFNTADIDGLANMYAIDAVNEQAVFSEPLVGREAIRKLLEIDFGRAKMVCIEERVYECGDTAILQWKDPSGLKGCGFFQFRNGEIIHQKGYFDQLSFFKSQGLPIPADYLDT
ncbi:nuclear transport factor 2 family protein [Leptolyngbya cf. ectocarpi LEGE 11479]|uniref:Nuclear transport factor 2 family protein n=1 Tax=Leptolyngbya cf. ectocarpi LEGE 11479 TaxID=1828722 RepID=A0A928ZYW7_LEPEC|nr:nuclear transport factor 2 family protein [Leptolyngbya ectocarpi]MBE9070049.1 nuclear transport factor 2 family protein [Leptolyngbya cf. ectocarpi LEGE 11479]